MVVARLVLYSWHCCGMLSDDQFRRMLTDCRFDGKGQRPGFVAFNAPCIAARLAAQDGVTHQRALLDIEERAQRLGGELVEGEVLWLPSDRI
jgi:hypothetical protein